MLVREWFRQSTVWSRLGRQKMKGSGDGVP